MINYKLKIEYDGTGYMGWQRLENKDTIQGKIEQVLSKLYDHKIEIHGAGRTDAGVHAVGQIANFKAKPCKSTKEIQNYLNRYLPESIAVTEVSEADERFHSRLNAKEKIYRYRILNSPIYNVFNRRYVHKVSMPLDLNKMKEGAGYFVGQHDFKAFCSNKKLKKSSVREIYAVDIEKVGDEISITYRGNGFLYNMVRIMTGTLIDVGLGKTEPWEIPNIIASKNREKAGETAPAKGLTLMEVIY